MRFFKRLFSCARPWLCGALVLLVFGCASATGMRLKLDYSSEAAAQTTQARIDNELSPEQQWRFYHAVAFLGIRAIMDMAPKNLDTLYQTLLSGGADTLFSPGQSQPNFGVEADGRALMQQCFGGKTPQQVVDEAEQAGAFKGNGPSQMMQLFLKQASQLGGQ